MHISVIGCGYVGLVSGACLAAIGHEVVCADSDDSKIRKLNAGEVPIYEEHLDKVIEVARRAGKLSFTNSVAEAVRSGDAIFICVGTPPLADGGADLSAIESVARVIASEARTPKLVIEKSTVPVQTGQQVKRALQVYGRDHGATFRVASNPEFLREGTAVEDLLHPDRIVVRRGRRGIGTPASRNLSADRGRKNSAMPDSRKRVPCLCRLPSFIVTTINSAELIDARVQFISRVENFLRQFDF